VKTLLITGVGGNVGQGILKNIKKNRPSCIRIGTDILDFNAGHHLCNKMFKVPYAINEKYIDCIRKIVNEESVDLIFPSTDEESYQLSLHRNEIPAVIVTSLHQTVDRYIDKYKTYLYHSKLELPFADSRLPSEYMGEFENCIVKPRRGRGSRGISINPDDFSLFDDSYLVQELLEGIEITTAFYVDITNHLYSMITLERELENGATNKCLVTRKYDERLKEIIEKLIANNKFQGSVNVQSIVSSGGNIVPFEINCRISGTNSIRSHFGFNDVEYALVEYLDKKELLRCEEIKEGVAVRVLSDVIYLGAKSYIDFDNIKPVLF